MNIGWPSDWIGQITVEQWPHQIVLHVFSFVPCELYKVLVLSQGVQEIQQVVTVSKGVESNTLQGSASTTQQLPSLHCIPGHMGSPITASETSIACEHCAWPSSISLHIYQACTVTNMQKMSGMQTITKMKLILTITNREPPSRGSADKADTREIVFRVFVFQILGKNLTCSEK